MQKAYVKRNWKNRPDPSTPLGESNLIPVDNAIDEIDNRVVTLDTTKANQSDLLTCIASITFNETTGILTITLKNGSATTIDTGLAKLAVNFDYDEDPTSEHYQQIIMEMKDGTYKYIDLSALITQFEFTNTATISWVVGNDGTVQASIVAGSIQNSHLSPTLQAQINGAQGYSEESEAWAVGQKSGTDVPSTDPQYHNNSKYYSELADDFAEDSEAWAVGKRDGTDVPSTDPTYQNNAKYWAEQAQTMSHGDAVNIAYDNTTSLMTATNAQAAIDELANPAFTEASTRANIASGESFKTIFGKIKKFFTDLATVAFSGSYNDLSNKPTIPTNTNQLTNGAGFITSAGSCAYASGAGNADTVDGSHAWNMQSLSAAGGTHGASSWLVKCQHNVDGDNYFKFVCGDGSLGTKVDYAAYAASAGSAGSATSARYADEAPNNFSIYNGYSLLLYNGNGAFSQLFTAGNGTLSLKSAADWINLRATYVQCRSINDDAWSRSLAAGFDVKSSRRYKENIIDISEEDTRKLLDVRVVQYDYKDGIVEGDTHKYNQHGVIAEEVVDVLPEVVSYAIPYGQEDEFDEPVPDAVDYSRFVPYLIKMVQMQQAEIDDLKSKVEELMSR